MPTTFTRPRNNAAARLDAGHVSGSTLFVLQEGEGEQFGTPSPDAPIRITVIPASNVNSNGQMKDPTLYTIFKCTHVSGDTLTVGSPVEGSADTGYAIGDVVACLVTSGEIEDIQDALLTLEQDVEDLQGSSASDVTVVHKAGPSETITSPKTFTQTIVGSISGNAGTVTNGVVTSGSYSDPSWIASLAGSKLTGTVVATNGVVTTGSYSDPSWITSLAGSKVSGNISGNASSLTGSISESQVTSLTTDLALKAPLASPTFTTQIITPIAYGGSSSTGNLTLTSTSHATKGNVYFNGTTVYVNSSGQFNVTGAITALTGATHDYAEKILDVRDNLGAQILTVVGDGRVYVGGDSGGYAAFVMTKPATGIFLSGGYIAQFQDLTQTGTPILAMTAIANTICLAREGAAGIIAFGNTSVSLTQMALDTGTGQVQIPASLLTPIVYGSASSAGDVTLTSTSHATKGKVYLNGTTTYVDGSSNIVIGGNLTLPEAGNVVLGTTTGTKIGTSASQKIGFYNTTPIVQPTAVADATDAGTVITQLNALLAKLRALGLIAT